MSQQQKTNTDVYHLIVYNKPGFENLGFTHMHIHNIVFDIHIFSMNRCKWMKKSQLQQKIGPAKAKQRGNATIDYCKPTLPRISIPNYYWTYVFWNLRFL